MYGDLLNSVLGACFETWPPSGDGGLRPTSSRLFRKIPSPRDISDAVCVLLSPIPSTKNMLTVMAR